MKAAIYNYGPIVVRSFSVYLDYQKYYTKGIYHKTEDSPFQGYHSAKVIGWGSDNGVPYWLAVNSWGTDWGMNGFYKMRRGTNECGFEDGAVWGVSSTESCFPLKNQQFTTTARPHHGHSSASKLLTETSLITFALFAILVWSRYIFEKKIF